jgi:hypothetical protein
MKVVYSARCHLIMAEWDSNNDNPIQNAAWLKDIVGSERKGSGEILKV